MAFRIGVYGHVTFIQVRQDRVRQRARGFRGLAGIRRDLVLGDQHGDAGALRVVILAGNVENMRANDPSDLGQNLRQALSVIEFIDVIDVLLAVLLRLRVANIVDIESGRFCEVVESVEFELIVHLRPSRLIRKKKEPAWTGAPDSLTTNGPSEKGAYYAYSLTA